MWGFREGPGGMSSGLSQTGGKRRRGTFNIVLG